MKLVADGIPIRSRRGDRHMERLPPRVAGALGQDIPEHAVGLVVDLVEAQARNAVPVLVRHISGNHLVIPRVGVVHDPLGRCHDLGAFVQAIRQLHHALGNVKYNRCLRPVRRRREHLRGRLVVRIQKIQRNGRSQFTLPLLLGYLDVHRPELPCAVLPEDTENIPDDPRLPRKQPEGFPFPLRFRMREHLDKPHRTVRHLFIVMRCGKHEPCGLVICQQRVICRPWFSLPHHIPPSSSSISSPLPAPLPAMIRLLAEGVSPSCSAHLFMSLA